MVFFFMHIFRNCVSAPKRGERPAAASTDKTQLVHHSGNSYMCDACGHLCFFPFVCPFCWFIKFVCFVCVIVGFVLFFVFACLCVLFFVVY